MRWKTWMIALAAPATMLAASLIYWLQQPPCRSFIDGPCGNREAFFGFWWSAFYFSAAALAAVVIALLVRVALLLLRRRSASLPH